MNTFAVAELFHLLFLEHLSKRCAQNLFALKGGCNLRFYFKSIRYSEDIDIDVHTVSVMTLQSNVRKILKSKAFIDTLRSRDIEIAATSEPKQTQTTQRWKIALRLQGIGREFQTKVEFSRRDETTGATIQPIDPDIIGHYKLYPIHFFHYTREQAISQKITALIGRSQTQARDVFDLSLLSREGRNAMAQPLSPEKVDKAYEHLQSLSFDDFKAQVIAFLMPEYLRYYDNAAVWKELVANVTDMIRGSRE